MITGVSKNRYSLDTYFCHDEEHYDQEDCIIWIEDVYNNGSKLRWRSDFLDEPCMITEIEIYLVNMELCSW